MQHTAAPAALLAAINTCQAAQTKHSKRRTEYARQAASNLPALLICFTRQPVSNIWGLASLGIIGRVCPLQTYY